jgi:hypothetical protein
MPHAQTKLPIRADPGKSGQNITRKDVTSTYIVWVSGELIEDSGINDGPEPILNSPGSCGPVCGRCGP